MAKIPKIKISGVGSIPSGYTLGRISAGTGDVELIPAGALAHHIASAGASTSSSGGGGGGSGSVTSVAMTVPAGMSVSGSPITTSGTLAVTLANDLAALEGLGSTGLAARTGTDTWAQRTLTAPAAGFTITNPAGVAGNPTYVLANDLAALEAMSGTGLVARTASETYAQRTITGTASRLTVTNGDGVSGNPTLDINTSYVGQASITTLGTITTGTWNGGAIASSFIQGTGTNDDAAAGKIGEYITSNIPFASSVTLTTNTVANITSISLTAGDWDVHANFFLDLGGTTLLTQVNASVNSTSATLGTAGTEGYMFMQNAWAAGTDCGFPVGTRRFSLATTTTIYFVIYALFTVSTCKAYGTISARRAR